MSSFESLTPDGPGYERFDAFTTPGIGAAMHADVVELVHRRARGESISPVIVFDESQPDFDAARPQDSVAKVFRVHRRPAFIDFLTDPEVITLVRDELGDEVDCFLSQFIFKNPGAWGQPWHQDSYYFKFEPPRPICALWLAVSEATLENGCLHVVPGSHRDGLHHHGPDHRPSSLYGYVEVPDVAEDDSVAVSMNPGDLLLFDSHLLHRSSDNSTVEARTAMVFHFCRAGTADLGHPLAPDGVDIGVNDFMPLIRDGECVAERDQESP